MLLFPEDFTVVYSQPKFSECFSDCNCSIRTKKSQFVLAFLRDMSFHLQWISIPHKHNLQFLYLTYNLKSIKASFFLSNLLFQVLVRSKVDQHAVQRGKTLCLWPIRAKQLKQEIMVEVDSICPAHRHIQQLVTRTAH